MRILILDDDPQSVEPLQQEIQARFAEVQSQVSGFDHAERVLESFNPHIVILDIMQGAAADNNPVGLQTREYIWEKRFCPLVVYTARPDQVDEDIQRNHPFFRVVPKGSRSEEKVVALIQEYEPHISALNDVNNEIHRALNRALKEVAPRVFESMENLAQRRDALTRFARRRVAAAMDDALSSGGPNLRSWEQYLCPPTITGHLLTGDIIRKRAGDSKDPSSYAVILTPSCDLVRDEDRQPKVDKILAAMCSGVEQLLPEVGLDVTSRRDKCKDRLLPLLRQGHGHWCLPVPALPGEFPTMVADFRRLELINISQIGDGETEYVRVASVDNPFRELVAWAYILCAARPGLPDRDFDAWIEEIVVALPEPERKPERR